MTALLASYTLTHNSFEKNQAGSVYFVLAIIIIPSHRKKLEREKKVPWDCWD